MSVNVNSSDRVGLNISGVSLHSLLINAPYMLAVLVVAKSRAYVLSLLTLLTFL